MQSTSFTQLVGFVAAPALRAAHKETTPTRVPTRTNQFSLRADDIMRVPPIFSLADCIKCPEGAPRLKKMTDPAGAGHVGSGHVRRERRRDRERRREAVSGSDRGRDDVGRD